MFQSQRYLFFVSKTPWVDVQRLFWIVFGSLKRVLGPSKTWILYSTSIKNQLFHVLASKTPFEGTFEALWESLRLFPEPFSGVFLGSLGHFDGGTCQQLSFSLPPRQVLERFLAFEWFPGCLSPGFGVRFWLFGGKLLHVFCVFRVASVAFRHISEVSSPGQK